MFIFLNLFNWLKKCLYYKANENMKITCLLKYLFLLLSFSLSSKTV
jgi:hypothetical protein